jgi:threonyl-tRNA synthetase
VQVFWHSAAHVLGAALEAELGPQLLLCDGPALLTAEGGFFYEMHLRGGQAGHAPAGGNAASGVAATPAAVGADAAPDAGAASLVAWGRGGGTLNESVMPALERRMRALAKERHPFVRIDVSAAQAARVFADNPFKLQMLSRIPRDQRISLYRCGPFVDLCRGPHLPHTGYLKALQLYRVAGSHWQGPPPPGLVAPDAADAAAAQPPLLQRVYGVAFPSSGELARWREGIEDAKRRDHRLVGKAQQLFFFHDASPGSAFFLPHGTRIYNRVG